MEYSFMIRNGHECISIIDGLHKQRSIVIAEMQLFHGIANRLKFKVT
jgi:hypothetical protein